MAEQSRPGDIHDADIINFPNESPWTSRRRFFCKYWNSIGTSGVCEQNNNKPLGLVKMPRKMERSSNGHPLLSFWFRSVGWFGLSNNNKNAEQNKNIDEICLDHQGNRGQRSDSKYDTRINVPIFGVIILAGCASRSEKKPKRNRIGSEIHEGIQMPRIRMGLLFYDNRMKVWPLKGCVIC